MRLPAHLMIGYFLSETVKEKFKLKNSAPFLIGSIIPDLGFTILSIWFVFKRSQFFESSSNYTTPTYTLLTDPLNADPQLFFERDQLYFNDPVWIGTHNLLHSPIILSFLFIIGYFVTFFYKKLGNILIGFALGCMLHTSLDVFTHHNDGPLLLFPFNWDFRYTSPISYWDPNHFGEEFTLFERILTISLFVYFLGKKLVTDRSKNRKT